MRSEQPKIKDIAVGSLVVCCCPYHLKIRIGYPLEYLKVVELKPDQGVARVASTREYPNHYESSIDELMHCLDPMVNEFSLSIVNKFGRVGSESSSSIDDVVAKIKRYHPHKTVCKRL